MSDAWPGQPVEWPGEERGAPPPARTFAERAMRIAGQFGAGFNRNAAATLAAPVDLYNAGLRAAGLPALAPGAANRAATGAVEALTGPAPEPEGGAERLARGAGAGLVDAATVMLPAAGVARATQAGTLANRAATALTQQPAMQALSGMAGGAVAEETGSAGAGMAASLAVPLGAAALGRVVSPVRQAPNPERAALVAAAEREGIPVTAGQATGSRFLQNVESGLEQLPLTAGPQRDIRDAQQRAFTGAVARRFGGRETALTPDVLNAHRERIGGAIKEIANRNTLAVTPELRADLDAIDDGLRFLPGEVAAPVKARLDQLRGMVVPGTPPAQGAGVVPAGGAQGAPVVPDTIPGASYRMMDSALGRTARSTSNGDMRAALTDLRERLRTAMDGSISPEDAEAWREARRQYANLMVASRAAGGAGEAGAVGQVSPAQLRGAVNQGTGQGYAFGRGDLNELARVGQAVVRQPPDSGTAGRAYAASLLTGALPGAGIGAAAGGPEGAMIGSAVGLALPRMAQMLMNSDLGQAYLRNQAVRSPVMTRELVAALLAQQGAPQAIPAP